MDATDHRILKVLARDSSLTAAELGTRVGLSSSAAHRRVKSLEATGAITGYRARLSAAATGNPTVVFVSVTLTDQSEQSLSRFETAARRAPDITAAHLMSGHYDYLLKIPIREGDSYERVHRDVLSRLPGVQRIVSHFAIRTVSDDT